MRIVWLSVLVFAIGCCSLSTYYEPPARSSPNALAKFRFSNLRAVAGADTEIRIWIRMQDDGYKLAYESVPDPPGAPGRSSRFRSVREMQSVRIPAGVEMTIRMELEYVWWIRRFESGFMNRRGSFYSDPGWVERQRRAGCRSEIRLEAAEDSIYFLDYTSIGQRRCQIMAYEQSFDAGFHLRQVSESHHSEATSYYPPMQWGTFDF